MQTIGFSGANGGDIRALCHHFLAAPSRETAIIQQIHIVAGHAICALVESAMLHELQDAGADRYAMLQLAP